MFFGANSSRIASQDDLANYPFNLSECGAAMLSTLYPALIQFDRKKTVPQVMARSAFIRIHIQIDISTTSIFIKLTIPIAYMLVPLQVHTLFQNQTLNSEHVKRIKKIRPESGIPFAVLPADVWLFQPSLLPDHVGLGNPREWRSLMAHGLCAKFALALLEANHIPGTQENDLTRKFEVCSDFSPTASLAPPQLGEHLRCLPGFKTVLLQRKKKCNLQIQAGL